jgi:hypothetical protein
VVASLVVFLVMSVAGSREAHAQGHYAGPPPGARPYGVYRSGLVVGFAVGGGSMALNCDSCDSLGGLAAEFHIGGMVAPRLALEFDVSTVVHPFSQNEGGGSLSSNFGAVALQYWVHRMWWIKAGLGVGDLQTSDQSGYTVDQSKAGFGVLLAGGVELLQTYHFAMDLQLRLTAASFSDVTVDGNSAVVSNVSLMLGFNWY